jgi:hypothetical protein
MLSHRPRRRNLHADAGRAKQGSSLRTHQRMRGTTSGRAIAAVRRLCFARDKRNCITPPPSVRFRGNTSIIA